VLDVTFAEDASRIVVPELFLVAAFGRELLRQEKTVKEA